MTSSTEERSRFRLSVMRPRDPHEPGRAATPLELFFDLVFVVAVSHAGAQLHHALTENHIADGLVSYGMVFFAIWWAWMNFTWFATSFSTDDWLYRVLTIVQMGGVLVLAAGIEPAFTEHDFTIATIGYVVMRLATVTQWLRASRCGGPTGRTTLAYAAGIGIVQILWLAQLAVPDALAPIAMGVLVVAELAVPVLAETRGLTPWHPHHITERYSLFTLIVLGESLLASANAIIDSVHEHEAVGPLVSISALALGVTAALWWIYFWPPHYRAIGSLRQSLRYGYVHYFVFAAAAAVSVGIEVLIDVATHHSKLGPVGAAYTLVVPIAVFVLGIWWLAILRNADRLVNAAVPIGALLVLVVPVVGVPLWFVAVILAAVVAVLVARSPVVRPKRGE